MRCFCRPSVPIWDNRSRLTKSTWTSGFHENKYLYNHVQLLGGFSSYNAYSALKPLTWRILICFTMVLFPDSPAPERQKSKRNIRYLLTCETRPHTHTHMDHTPLLEIAFYNMFTIEPLLMFGYKHCTSPKCFLFRLLQKTLNEQTVNFIHGCDFIWGNWEARTVLHGHGWNNKLDYSTRYCGPNHKITFLDLVNAFRFFFMKRTFNVFRVKIGRQLTLKLLL